MNYAAAFLALIGIASTAYWYTSGRKFYSGPLIEAEIDDTSDTDLVGHNLDQKEADEKGDVKV